MATYGPAPGLNGRTFQLWVLNGWVVNFCVRSTPLRGITMVIDYLIQSQVHVYVPYAVDTYTVLMQIYGQYKNEGETLTKNYKHKICFRQKRKGNIYISCACTNARLPSLAVECRG